MFGLDTVRTMSAALGLFVAINSSGATAEELMEEIVVVAKSIKASKMAALESKRDANNVADIISADAIGRFPDQNLADVPIHVLCLLLSARRGRCQFRRRARRNHER